MGIQQKRSCILTCYLLTLLILQNTCFKLTAAKNIGMDLIKLLYEDHAQPLSAPDNYDVTDDVRTDDSEDLLPFVHRLKRVLDAADVYNTRETKRLDGAYRKRLGGAYNKRFGGAFNQLLIAAQQLDDIYEDGLRAEGRRFNAWGG